MDDLGHTTFDVRIRAVRAVLDGMAVTDVARAFGLDRSTLHRWLQRHRAGGETALRRKSGSGRPRTLAILTPEELRRTVLQPATSFGFETDLWTVGRLGLVFRTRYDTPVSNDTVWRRLREAGLTCQKPQRQYFEIDEEVRRDWMRRVRPQIRRAVRENKAILYFQDESHISLTAFLGKTWAPRGATPVSRVTGNRGGVSAVSALSGLGRLIFALHEQRIASGEVIDFLGRMMRHHSRRHLVVVMDQAPPHVSKKTKDYIASQARLRVFYLPAYSPDWNPDEKVWNHLKTQELKSHQAKTKEQLRDLTIRKLTQMSKDSDLLQGLFFRCCVADLFR